MKQDLLDIVTPGYELNNALVGDEVVNFAKLNTTTYTIVSNSTGEIESSTNRDGTITGDERIYTTTSDIRELNLPLNEIFNDYNNNVIGIPTDLNIPVIGGSGNHIEGIANNVWIDFSSIGNHIEGGYNNITSSGWFMFGTRYENEPQVITDSKDIRQFKTDYSHVEGNSNNLYFSENSHIEGNSNTAVTHNNIHIEGTGNTAYGTSSHVEGASLTNAPISNLLELTRNFTSDLQKISGKITEIKNNADSLNNPSYDTIVTPDPYTLLAAKSLSYNGEGLNNAIANQFLSYSYSHNNVPNFVLSNYSKGIAFGDYSHVEGGGNTTFGTGSHSEGLFTTTPADYSHSEGYYNNALNKGSHVEGAYNTAGSFVIFDENGKDVTRSVDNTYISEIINQPTYFTDFGSNSSTRLIFDKASVQDNGSYSESKFLIKTGYQYETTGEANSLDTTDNSQSLTSMPFFGIIPYIDDIKGYQHAEGYNNVSFGSITHTEGFKNWAITPGSHVEGIYNLTTIQSTLDTDTDFDSLLGLHVEGKSNVVFGYGAAHIEGVGNFLTAGNYDTAHIEGISNINDVNGQHSHIEGYKNYNNATGSHIEGGIIRKGNNVSIFGNYVTYNHEDYYTLNSFYSISQTNSWGPKTTWSSYYELPSVTLPGGEEYVPYGTEKSNAIYAGIYNHVEGVGNFIQSSSSYCHVEGQPYSYMYDSSSSANETHNYYANAYNLINNSSGCHVEGAGNTVTGQNIHSEGVYNNSQGIGSHIEGFGNTVNTSYGHTEGIKNTVYGIAGHTEGYGTYVTAMGGHAEGVMLNRNTSSDTYDVISDILDESSNIGNIIIYDNGSTTKNVRQLIIENTPIINKDTYSQYYNKNSSYGPIVHGKGGHSEGAGTIVESATGHAEGLITSVNTGNSKGAHAEGILTKSQSYGSHTEGIGTYAVGIGGHAEGIGDLSMPNVTSIGGHTEGYHTHVNGNYGHAEGQETQVNRIGGHAEGYKTTVNANYGHAEGSNNIVSGVAAHVGGTDSQAIGSNSFAHGLGIIVPNNNATAFGTYNIPPTTTNNIFMIGNGNSNSERSNALELDINGNLTIKQDITYNNGISLIDEIERIWNAIRGGGGGGGSTTLAGLTDVDITNPTDGQILIYNATTGKWVNGNMPTPTPSGSNVETGTMTSLMTGSELDIISGTMEEINE